MPSAGTRVFTGEREGGIGRSSSGWVVEGGRAEEKTGTSKVSIKVYQRSSRKLFWVDMVSLPVKALRSVDLDERGCDAQEGAAAPGRG